MPKDFLAGAKPYYDAVVIGSGLAYLATHPNVVPGWWQKVIAGQWHSPTEPLRPQTGWSIAAACVWLFPRLALGLSGFELGLIIMPLIRGRPGDDPRRPAGRIRATRRMLVAVALLGTAFLLSSSFVTSLLIPAEAFVDRGAATHRAIAYLAHGGPLSTGEPASSTISAGSSGLLLLSRAAVPPRSAPPHCLRLFTPRPHFSRRTVSSWPTKSRSLAP